MATLRLQPVRWREAKAWIAERHRHLTAPTGWLFGIAAVNAEGEVVGVACVSRPVSRHLDDGWSAEVSRCCTDGTPNACSCLYRACWRAVKAMGYRRLITYTLPTESGSSLRGAGFTLLGERGGGQWSRKDRPRAPAKQSEPKLLWSLTA